MKRKQKQQSLEDDPAKRSLNLADLSDHHLEPKYISNMTIHSWKKKEDSDSDDDLLTMSPTTIERWKKEGDSDSDDDLLTMSPTTIERWKKEEDSDSVDDLLTMSPTTIERLDRDPFKHKLRPRDIKLSEAMASSAAAISRYDDNFEVLRLSTILGLEMGATVISNQEAIKKEGWLMKVRGIR